MISIRKEIQLKEVKAEKDKEKDAIHMIQFCAICEGQSLDQVPGVVQ